INLMAKYNASQKMQNYLYSLQQDHPLIDNILIVTPDAQYSSNKKEIDPIYNGMSIKEETVNKNYFISFAEADESIRYSSDYEEKRNESYVLEDLNNTMFFGTNLEILNDDYRGTVLVFIKPENLSDTIF